jgi:hypothetical protein
LREEIDGYVDKADQIWGCNSAATWLFDQGYPVTHALTVDQMPHMVKEWYSAPPLKYLLASTVHPHLTKYLKARGRDITFFNNYVGVQGPPLLQCECSHFKEAHPAGICLHCGCKEYREIQMPFEMGLYGGLFEETAITGSGLNATTRGLDLAGYMGFKKAYVLGADCAIRLKRRPPEGERFGTPAYMKWLNEDAEMHADGGSAVASEATPITLGGEIDGRWWETKPDLAITASWLVKMAKAIPNIELVGDTLPNALMDKPDSFLDQLPQLTNDDEIVPINIAIDHWTSRT